MSDYELNSLPIEIIFWLAEGQLLCLCQKVVDDDIRGWHGLSPLLLLEGKHQRPRSGQVKWLHM